MTIVGGTGENQLDYDQQGGADGFEGAPIVGHSEISAEDYKKIFLALPQNRSALKGFGIMALAGPTFVALHRAMLPRGEEPGELPWLYLLPAVTVPLALGWVLWRAREKWADNAVSDLRSLEGVKFRFDAEGMTVDAPGKTQRVAWNSLVRCLEMPEAFAIYTSPAAIILVPKRAFALADQARLKQTLLALVPERPLRGVRVNVVRTPLIWLGLVVFFLVVWRLFEP